MPNGVDTSLGERLAEIERDLSSFRNALVLLGLKRCVLCGKFVRVSDSANIFDYGEAVCSRCVPEWWGIQSGKLSVNERESLEFKLVAWLQTHHGAKIFRDPLKAHAQPHDFRFVATCCQCCGSGLYAGRRCRCCDSGTVWVLVSKDGFV